MITNTRKKQATDLAATGKAINKFLRAIDQPSSSKSSKGEVSYSDFFDDKMLIIKSIRSGIPYNLFAKIKSLMPFTDDDWAEYLNLSTKTLQRHRNDESYVFKPIHTEKIIEIAEVTKYGNEVFDSAEQFYVWLNSPSLALGNIEPAELLKDSYGKGLVMAELNRIEHGIFA